MGVIHLCNNNKMVCWWATPLGKQEEGRKISEKGENNFKSFILHKFYFQSNTNQPTCAIFEWIICVIGARINL